MKAPVKEEGVLIPRELLGKAREVEIRQDLGGQIVVIPLYDYDEDPIWDLGKNPVSLGITDASVNLDKYLTEQ
jgi:hypothetical protein